MIPRRGHPVNVRTPRSVCKICWESVYSDEDVAWVITPNPGLAHTRCAQKARQRR